MTFQEAAKRYASLGLKVFPLRKGSRTPMLKRWPEKATDDLSTIYAWLDKWPGSGLAVATGERSGVVVLDVDNLQSLEGKPLPETWTVETRPGRYHLYFKWPGFEIGNSVSKVGFKLDIRGDRGFVVVPPTINTKSGRPYTWVKAPWDVPIADLPRWIVEGGLIPEGQRNDRLFRIGCGLRARGYDDDELLAELRAINAERCVPPLGETEVRQITEGICKRYDPGRRIVQIVSGRLPDMVDEAEETILDMLFQRGLQLVTLVRGDDGRLTARPASKQYLIDLFSKSVHWEKFDARSKKWIRKDCPPAVAETYLARVGAWRVPVLRAIVQAPTLRPDGSVLQEPGYDRRTGIFADFQDFPAVSQKPSRSDAAAALAELEKVLEGFPFVEESDRSAAIAAILTAVARGAVSTAPLFAFRSPTPRTGKSLLADVVALIALGRPAAAMSQGRDSDEQRKRIFSLLLAAEPLVVIDNVERPLGGEALCSVLTQAVYRDRVLGKSTTADVVTGGTTWLATGNNLTIAGDLTARTVLCDLDAGVENPEERRFEIIDLRRYVLYNRRSLVKAALTVLRAAEPQDLPPWGGFEAWSALVRSAIVACGRADPCAGRERLQAEDPERENLRAVHAAWDAAFGTNAVTVADIVKCGHEDLRAALASVTGQTVVRTASGELVVDLNPRKVGKYLAKIKGRLVDGRKLVKAGELKKSSQWALRPGGF